MGIGEDQATEERSTATRSGPRRRALRALGIVLLFLVVGFGILWVSRERIADNVIAGQLQKMGLPATYKIARIGGSRQILTDIRVGAPGRTDLTVERAEVQILYPFGLPQVGALRLVRPRLYGTYANGAVSFGTLDKVLFPEKDRVPEPFRLPDLDLRLEDGRARILTDFGPVGMKVEGSGNLRNGFAGIAAAVSPKLQRSDCTLEAISAYGRISIRSEMPRFSGPVRMSQARCPEQRLFLQSASAQLDVGSDAALKVLSAQINLRSREARSGTASAQSLALDGKATWREGALNMKVAGDIGGVQTPAVAIALMGLEGRLRALEGFGKVEFQGTLDGRGLATGPGLTRSLAEWESAGGNSFVGPVIAQLRQALDRERPGSRLFADFVWKQTSAGQKAEPAQTLVVPMAQVRGGGGDTLLALSRFQFVNSGKAGTTPLLSGNFSTGGRGLPQIVGRMERDSRARSQFRLAMAPYRAGAGEVAVPALSLGQGRDGATQIAGMVHLTGPLPGGFVRKLVLPVDGTYSPDGTLALFRKCVTPRFDALALGSLTVERRDITLCPAGGGAIVKAGAKGVQIAAGAPALDLVGTLGETPIRIASGPIGLAWPGTFAARALVVELGPEDTATRFRLNNLTARIGSDVTGTFDGADAQLFAVPLDITEARGAWRYAGNRLTIANGRFDLLDRQDPDRFRPLIAEGASLSLAANRIDARALLREPSTGREVVTALIRHDLSSGAGHADLAVGGLIFDKALQPDRITPLALGVVANVAGTVRGRGVIDWDQRGVTSSGSFSSEALDFAAAFGPVKGLSGSVRFTDLLGLVTAPGQRLKVASVNPGIEVSGGEVEFALLPNYLLRLQRGHWPFLGGTLTLQPVELNLGIAETRRYVLSIEGLDAGQFVQHMDLENISATGTFDGELPLVFDSFGGRVAGGLLVSRPPGGNLSYVGALTYKDLSAMANFAFDALKSLDYRHMTIAMDGALEGEIVTRVRFDGVRQGAGAKRNFLTRAVGNLPIQFNINIRAPFYRLISSVKAMYDPAFIEDPRLLGLVDSEGRPVRANANGVRAPGQPVIVLPSSGPATGVEGDIQPPESGKKR